MKSLQELIEELNATDETVTIEAKRGRATYYIIGKALTSAPVQEEGSVVEDRAKKQAISTDSALPNSQSAPPNSQSAPPISITDILSEIKDLIALLGKKSDVEKVKEIIIMLCKWRALSAVEIAGILNKSEKHVLRAYITPLRSIGKIEYTIPDMVNHPNQAYKA